MCNMPVFSMQIFTLQLFASTMQAEQVKILDLCGNFFFTVLYWQ